MEACRKVTTAVFYQRNTICPLIEVLGKLTTGAAIGVAGDFGVMGITGASAAE